MKLQPINGFIEEIRKIIKKYAEECGEVGTVGMTNYLRGLGYDVDKKTVEIVFHILEEEGKLQSNSLDSKLKNYRWIGS